MEWQQANPLACCLLTQLMGLQSLASPKTFNKSQSTKMRDTNLQKSQIYNNFFIDNFNCIVVFYETLKEPPPIFSLHRTRTIKLHGLLCVDWIIQSGFTYLAGLITLFRCGQSCFPKQCKCKVSQSQWMRQSVLTKTRALQSIRFDMKCFELSQCHSTKAPETGDTELRFYLRHKFYFSLLWRWWYSGTNWASINKNCEMQAIRSWPVWNIYP